MFEQEPESRFLALAKGVGGFFIGSILGVLIPVMMFGFIVDQLPGQNMDRVRFLLAELLDLGVLGGLGYAIYRNMEHSAFLRGMLIGISLSFLLNAICGVVMLGVR